MKNYSLHAPVWQQWKIAAFEWSSSSISTSLFLPLLRTLDLLLLVIALVKWNRSRGEHTRVSLLSVCFSERQNRKASWLEHIEKGRCIETQWSMSAPYRYLQMSNHSALMNLASDRPLACPPTYNTTHFMGGIMLCRSNSMSNGAWLRQCDCNEGGQLIGLLLTKSVHQSQILMLGQSSYRLRSLPGQRAVRELRNDCFD